MEGKVAKIYNSHATRPAIGGRVAFFICVDYRRNVYIRIRLCILATLLVTVSASANHRGAHHEVFILGEMSTNPIRFFVCHDLSDALKITNEYQENGAQSAIWFASKLSTDKKCLVFNGFHILFQRIDVEAEIAEGTIIVGLVSVFRRDYKERLNTYEEMEKVYGIFQHVTVLRKGEGPKVLI